MDDGYVPPFYRPTNSSHILATGGVEQLRPSKLSSAWKPVVLKLERRQLVICRGHQQTLQSLELAHIRKVYSRENNLLCICLHHSSHELMFRCADDDSLRNWLQVIDTVRQYQGKETATPNAPVIQDLLHMDDIPITQPLVRPRAHSAEPMVSQYPQAPYVAAAPISNPYPHHLPTLQTPSMPQYAMNGSHAPLQTAATFPMQHQPPIPTMHPAPFPQAPPHLPNPPRTIPQPLHNHSRGVSAPPTMHRPQHPSMPTRPSIPTPAPIQSRPAMSKPAPPQPPARPTTTSTISITTPTPSQTLRQQVLQTWALQPPTLQKLRPIVDLMDMLGRLLQRHGIAVTIPPPAASPPAKRLRLWRKQLHPDKCRHMTATQQEVCNLVWTVLADAWDEYEKNSS